MPGGGLQHLVLVGAGRRHQAVLKELGVKRPVNLRVTVISHTARPIEAAHLPDFVMGFDTQPDCEADLGPLLQASGALLKLGQVATLNVPEKRLTLANDEVLPYDVLSVDTDNLQERAQTETGMPGALQRALFAQPVEVFFKLWPQFLQLTQHKAMNIAVIGDSLRATELALAVAARLANEAHTQAHRVTLVLDHDADAADIPPKLATVLAQALKKAHITVLHDRCVRVCEEEVQLASGMRLACDAPIVALSPAVPAWLHGQATPLAPVPFAAVSWTSLGHRRAACWVQTRWGNVVLTGPWAWAWKRWREQVHQKQTLCNKVAPSSPHGHSNP